ncbi:hypothetical protein SK128_016083 [Halocaridina rubra]|uniref:Uncharacterized protein n=1 Tax=Halocaridina rubra TaxID=373956 RepID=A0AAN9AH67_HALRR
MKIEKSVVLQLVSLIANTCGNERKQLKPISYYEMALGGLRKSVGSIGKGMRESERCVEAIEVE